MAENEFGFYTRSKLPCGISTDDDPAKVKHLDEVAERRGWQKFGWRDVLRPSAERSTVTPPIINRNRK